MSSPTVLIGGVPVARLFDTTLHGGSIMFGAATVLIGEFAAVGAVTVFPGQQHHNNCGVQSSSQLIHRATGLNLGEEAMLGSATGFGLAAAPTPAVGGTPAVDGKPAVPAKPAEKGGGTTAADRQALLTEFGVPSTVLSNYTKEVLASASPCRQADKSVCISPVPSVIRMGSWPCRAARAGSPTTTAATA